MGWGLTPLPSGHDLKCAGSCSLRLSHLSSLGRESAVSILQNHLWGEDWDTAEGKDGGIQVPYVSPGPRRLRNYTHCLQHPAWHPGEGQPPSSRPLRSPHPHPEWGSGWSHLEECWGVGSFSK